jgi:hypothetical protein
MRTIVPAVAVVAGLISLPALAVDPASPTAPAPIIKERAPKPTPAPIKNIDLQQPEDSATSGSSATPRSFGSEIDSIEADEERAKSNKDKFRQRPGYQEEAPQPRAALPLVLTASEEIVAGQGIQPLVGPGVTGETSAANAGAGPHLKNGPEHSGPGVPAMQQATSPQGSSSAGNSAVRGRTDARGNPKPGSQESMTEEDRKKK